MTNIEDFSGEMKNYFETLPRFLRKGIIKSDIEVNSLQELRSISKRLCQKGLKQKH